MEYAYIYLNNNNRTIKLKNTFILLMMLAMILLLNAEAWSITMTDVSKVTTAINNLKTLQSQAPAAQKNQYQNCINNLVTYQTLLQKAMVGSGPNPGSMPVCKVSSVAPATSVPVTINAPATVPVPAGKIGTFNVSFGGTGVAGATLQASTGLQASMKITGQSSGTSSAAISVTPVNGCTGGTITLLLTNSNKAVLKSQPIRVTVTGAASAPTNISVSTAAVGNLSITPPSGTIALSAGKSGTFPVSFSGTGVAQVTAQPSGSGLSARVLSTIRQSSPNTFTSNVSITAANNFQGGTVTFALLNNSRSILKSQTIAISAGPNLAVPTANTAATAAKSTATAASNSAPVAITAPDTFNVQAGKSTPLTVSFSGAGASRTALKVSGTGLSTSLSTSMKPYPTPSTATVTITPTNSSKGGTVTFQVSNSAGAVIGSKTINVAVAPAAANANTSPVNPVPGNSVPVAASATSDLVLSAPATYSLMAGGRGNFTVSFRGAGIDRLAAQASGTGLSAVILGQWQDAANITVATANNFTGGTVTVSLFNNTRGVIKSQTTAVQTTNSSNPVTVSAAQTTAMANSPSVTISAPAAFTAQAGKSTPLAVSFSGTGIANADAQTSVPGLTAQVTNLTPSAANIVFTPTLDCKGGTVTLRTINSAGAVIGSKTISVAVGSPDVPVATSSTPVANQVATPATTAVTGLTATSPGQAAVVGSASASQATQVTATMVSQANAEVGRLQTLQQQQPGNTQIAAQLQYAICQHDSLKQQSVGLPASQCGEPPANTATTATGTTAVAGSGTAAASASTATPIAFTFVTVNKNSGNTSDTFIFHVGTNATSSRVVVVGESTSTYSYPMTSSDNKNWSVSLNGDELGVGNKTLSIRAFPQNSMTPVTKTLNINITQAPLAFTSVNVDKPSGTPDDTFVFLATTNIVASKVTILSSTDNKTEHPMTSSDGKNWSASLKGSSLGTGNIAIVIRGYPPTGVITQNGALKVAINNNVAINNDEFVYPVHNPIQTGKLSTDAVVYSIDRCTRSGDTYGEGNYFNQAHLAWDYGSSCGTEIMAIHAGTVKRIGYEAGGYGHYIIIEHTDRNKTKFYSIYAHLKETPKPKLNDTVSPRQIIGTMGNTGSTGLFTHLHIAVWTQSDSDIYPYCDSATNNMNLCYSYSKPSICPWDPHQVKYTGWLGNGKGKNSHNRTFYSIDKLVKNNGLW